eukprot:TRINITY_DN922_c0_g2_i1.p1 TRINITY_DN922_c0_g2~~TRINITY_DN922_c0_g2_i1.p1  ORF type:complete len:417 (+),score=91.39 TRINITY_DN922_c0_g2_i1:124-1374(+)
MSQRQKVPLEGGFGLAAWGKLISTSADLAGNGGKLRRIPMSEVRQHSTRDDCWMVIRGLVYNVSSYMKYHPGGVGELMRGAGEDATELFNGVHAWVNLDYLLGKCLLGPVDNSVPAFGARTSSTSVAPSMLGVPGAKQTPPRQVPMHLVPPPTGLPPANAPTTATTATTSTASAAVLNPAEWHSFPLTAKTSETHNTIRLRFALPRDDATLGLPVGAHIVVGADIAGQLVTRPYTPVSAIDAKGYFELLVKVYKAGVISRFLDSLEIGAPLLVRGPKGEFKFAPNKWKHIGMIAGGTGIAPMFQVLRAIAMNSADQTRVTLLNANRTEEDILLRRELDELASEEEGRISIHHFLSRPADTWTGMRGHIGPETILSHMPSCADTDSIVLICGPPTMDMVMTRTLAQLGYRDENVFQF